jgi:ABC-type glutathione transport system ATPase component
MRVDDRTRMRPQIAALSRAARPSPTRSPRPMSRSQITGPAEREIEHRAPLWGDKANDNLESRGMPIALEISGLGVKRRSQWILRNIDTQIVDLDSLAILGQSGVGKTHLLRAIAGLLVPHEGNIVIDGKNPVSLHQKRQLDVIYQEPCLWPHRSVVQTLRLAAALYDDDVTRQQVTETLRAVDLPTERSFLPSIPTN